jgi:hypothetical protein
VSLFYRGGFPIQIKKSGQDLFFYPAFPLITTFTTTVELPIYYHYHVYTMDIDDIEELLLLLLVSRSPQGGQCVRTGQSGHEYVKELLESAHPERVFQVLRMRLATFYSLRDWLLENTNLRGDNITRNQRIQGRGRQVSVEEKLIIFIYIISRVASNRDTSERFSRSGDTISRYV